MKERERERERERKSKIKREKENQKWKRKRKKKKKKRKEGNIQRFGEVSVYGKSYALMCIIIVFSSDFGFVKV